MKELLSKFTFGFLMAQLFPGAIAVTSLSCAFLALAEECPHDGSGFVGYVLDTWSMSVPRVILFLVLATGMGMLIHGVHWTIVAALENRNDPDDPKPLWTLKRYGRTIAVQILCGPFTMLSELACLLRTKGIRPLLIDENVPCLGPNKMPMFDFLQDFYLSFAQFYAHTAYALLMGLLCLASAFRHIGFSFGRVLLILVLYAGTGIFFLLGRIQLQTLFRAEVALAEGLSIGGIASPPTGQKGGPRPDTKPEEP